MKSCSLAVQIRLAGGCGCLDDGAWSNALKHQRKTAEADQKPNQGVALEQLGQRQDALTQFEETLCLEPGDNSAAQYLEALRARRAEGKPRGVEINEELVRVVRAAAIKSSSPGGLAACGT